jgi:hypothetical protein
VDSLQDAIRPAAISKIPVYVNQLAGHQAWADHRCSKPEAGEESAGTAVVPPRRNPDFGRTGRPVQVCRVLSQVGMRKR